MIDLSINTTSPIAPFGLASILPLVVQPLSTEASTALASSITPASSTVALSSEGQLLSALAVFQDRLELLQTASADASPAVVLDTAEGLVNAFNDLQASTGNLQPLFAALSGDSPADRLALALNELATSVTTTDNSSPTGLPEIGIVLQLPSVTNNPASTAGAGITLRIEPDVLNAALAADPTAARTLLAETSQAFLEQASIFETAANAALSPISLPAPSVSLTVDQTEAGTLVAVATVDAAPAVPVDTVVNTALQQLTADNALNELLLADIDFSTTTLTETAAQVNAVTPAPANPVTEEIPDATLATPATPVATPPATPAPAITETGALAAANAADSEAFAATLALRDLLADPTRHAANNLLDPAYAALIAASHLRDFVPADQEGNPQAAAADFPAPVSGLASARAVASYLDARNNELRQQERAVV